MLALVAHADFRHLSAPVVSKNSTAGKSSWDRASPPGPTPPPGASCAPLWGLKVNIARSTVASILKDADIEPKPERSITAMPRRSRL